VRGDLHGLRRRHGLPAAQQAVALHPAAGKPDPVTVRHRAVGPCPFPVDNGGLAKAEDGAESGRCPACVAATLESGPGRTGVIQHATKLLLLPRAASTSCGLATLCEDIE